MWTYDRFTQRPLAAGLPAVALHLHRQNRTKKLFHFLFSFLLTCRLYFNVLLALKHQRFPCVTEIFSFQVTMKPPRDIPMKSKNAMAIRCQQNNFHPTPCEVQTSLVNRLTLVRLQKHRLPPSLCDPTAFLMSTTAPPQKNHLFCKSSQDSLKAKDFARYLIRVQHRRSQVERKRWYESLH